MRVQYRTIIMVDFLETYEKVKVQNKDKLLKGKLLKDKLSKQ